VNIFFSHKTEQNLQKTTIILSIFLINNDGGTIAKFETSH